MSTAESYRDQSFRNQPSLFDATVVTERVAGDHSGCDSRSPATGNANDSAFNAGRSPMNGRAEQSIVSDQGTRSRDETYHAVKEHHDHDRNLWFGRIVSKGRRGVTLDELSAEHNIPPNAFSGRITELKNKGLVVRTGERRTTRSGCSAAVIVATEFLHIPSTATSMEQTSMSTTIASETMPDQLTCLKTPVDQRGEPMCEGRVYLIGNQRCECFEAEGELFVQRIIRQGIPFAGSRPQLVTELPKDVRVSRVA